MTSSLAKSAAFLFCAALSASAFASAGQGFSWSFQTTTLSSSGSNVAAAMRNAEAWPVVISDASSSGGYGAAATLFSAGGTVGAPSGSWQNIGTGFFSNLPSRLRAASSPDGRVAFAAADTSGIGLGGRVSSTAGGWGSLPAGTKAVAFDSHGTLYTATNSSVSGVGGYAGNPIVDMSVSPFGEVGVVSADMKFWQFSAWLGTWSSTSLPSVGSSPLTESMDVEYDSLGRPHVVATVNNTLVAWDFSTVTGTWAATTIATNLGGSPRATLAANDNGTVGTAWVDSSGMLIYAYKHDLDNWATSVVTNTGFASGGQVGVTYDYADLPVLAYRSSNNSSINVAYDPVVVPEPADLSLIGVAATLLARRSRRTA